MNSLKQTLDSLYAGYNFAERLLFDPIEFPRLYISREDIEVAGFIASCFAYGKVGLFKPVVRNIIGSMGESPCEFLLKFRPGRDRELFSGIYYRFNRNNDILSLLYVLSSILRRYGSIEKLFMRYYRKGDPDTGGGIAGIADTFLRTDTTPVYGRNSRPAGFRQFFPSPLQGSACKRMNMFLRWMVRDRDIDFGIWKGVPKNRLVIPLDTHIARIARCLGLTQRASQDWKAAVEITGSLRALDPEDPLKYDFALCHQGIAGVCSAMHCKECGLSRELCG